MSTQKTVYWIVWGAVQWIVDGVLDRAASGASGAVWRAVRSAVDGAVDRAVSGDPSHPGLQDFLRSSGIRKTQ